MDTILIAILAPIFGLLVSLKTTKTITDKQLLKIAKLEEEASALKESAKTLVLKQAEFVGLSDRVKYVEHNIDQIDEKQARKMITLLQPVAKSLKDVQDTIGI